MRYQNWSPRRRLADASHRRDRIVHRNPVPGRIFLEHLEGRVFLSSSYTLSAAVITTTNGAVTATTVPAAPRLISATASTTTTSITLTWTSSGGGQTFLCLQRKLGLRGTYVNVCGASSLSAATTTFTDSGLLPATAYYYRIMADNSAGPSAYSNERSAITITPTPTSVTATVNSNAQVVVTWNPIPGASGYNVQRSEDGGRTWVSLNAAPVAGVSCIDANLCASAIYRVAAVACPTISCYSTPSAITPTTSISPTGVPSAPSNLLASGVSGTAINLTWIANGNNAAGFYILRSINGGLTFTSYATVGAGVTSYSDSAINNGSLYDYRVIAYNSLGQSLASNVSEAATVESLYNGVVPDATSTTIEAVDFDNGGSGIAYYDPAVPGQGVAYRSNALVGMEPSASANGGYDVGWTRPGEWLNYTIDIPTSGTYSVDPNVASTEAGGTFHIEFVGINGNSADVNTGEYTIPATGGWQSYTNLYTSVNLPAGQYVMHVAFDSWSPTGFIGNLDCIKLVPVVTTALSNSTVAIKRSWDTSYAQSAAITSSGVACYYLQVSNPGPAADDVIITGTAGDLADGWRVRYFNSIVEGYSGGTDVTAAVTSAAGWDIGVLGPGQTTTFRLEVDNLDNAPAGSSQNVAVTLTSAFDPMRIQTVQATTTAAVAQSVQLTRNNYDLSGIYTLNLTNLGDAPDSFTLVGPASGSGWTATYFDSAVGGNNITADVTAGTYVTSAIGPMDTHSLCVQISGSDITAALATLTATSVGDPAESDSVTVTPSQPAAPPSVFPIGVWSQPTYTFSTWQARGANTLVNYESLGGSVSMAQWVAAAQADGFYEIRQPSSTPGVDASDPNLIAYLQPDESDGNGLSPAVLAANYTAWKAADLSMPVFANFAGGYVVGQQGNLTAANYHAYAAGADVVGDDYYPITGWDRPDQLYMVGAAMDRLADYTNGMPQYAYIETGPSNVSWLDNGTGGPSAGQFRAEVWDAVINGAKGIIYFPQQFNPSFSYDDTTPAVAAEMTTQDATLKAMGNILLTPNDPSISYMAVSSPLQASWHSYNGKMYYIVLNLSDNTLSNQSLAISGFDSAASSASVYGESRTVAMTNGAFTDTFAPYSVHIYCVNNPSPATTASGALLGDVNHNGTVGYSDLAVLSKYYGQSGMSWQQGDFNGDGVVNAADWDLLMENFGTSGLFS